MVAASRGGGYLHPRTGHHLPGLAGSSGPLRFPPRRCGSRIEEAPRRTAGGVMALRRASGSSYGSTADGRDVAAEATALPLAPARTPPDRACGPPVGRPAQHLVLPPRPRGARSTDEAGRPGGPRLMRSSDAGMVGERITRRAHGVDRSRKLRVEIGGWRRRRLRLSGPPSGLSCQGGAHEGQHPVRASRISSWRWAERCGCSSGKPRGQKKRRGSPGRGSSGRGYTGRSRAQHREFLAPAHGRPAPGW